MALKRKRPTPDPLASDPEDEDYDATVQRSSHRSSRKSKAGSKSHKRRRERYRGDGSDVSEEDDLSEESFLEDSQSESEKEPELGPTGRPLRRAIQPQTYEESSGSEVAEEVSDNDEEDVKPQTGIVKLRVSPIKLRRVTRQRTGSIARSTRGMSVESATGTRRSGRLHRESSEPLVALTDSGKHEKVVEPGTSTKTTPRKSPPPPLRRVSGKKPLMSHISEEQLEDEDAQIIPSTAAQAEEQVDEDAVESIEKTEADHEDEDDDDDDDDDEDEGPVSRRKTNRSQISVVQDSEDEARQADAAASSRSLSRLTRGSDKTKRRDDDDDFVAEPSDAEADEESDAEAAPKKQAREESVSPVRGGRRADRSRSNHASRSESESEQALDPDEMAEELEELESDQRRSRRRRGGRELDARPQLRTRKSNVNYAIIRPDLLPVDNDDEPAGTPSRRKGNGATSSWQRNLFSTFGPFGGAAGPGFAGGAGDSDSSDDDRPRAGIGGAAGMTPTTANAPGLLGVGADPNALTGTPANLGKIKSRQALADADPLGVDPNVNFDSIGGLQNHINQLKEMVQLPLLYPEVFQRFKVTPPRGVLFHGPPGTGKTLLARALAASCSTEGRKITFYMRKGADALSKWVGEAERQLRLLFDEARNTQPSIIFFDEIDGLAPVRSSKQEQIHASIVSTLLALMDGMDGRGQVIVIGATNRPDSIDPALRRPGRFDREFYFPLPNVEARRSIINIHTRDWEPGLSDAFKDQLADVTKGYGGADLRALCTEAALNAVQRRYPQIYASNEKLVIDPASITVNARDFMLSLKKMVPSSERSGSSGASPLPPKIEPLLKEHLSNIEARINELIPRPKKTTALEEAQYEDYTDADGGFEREKLQQAFETSRVFRPRLLLHGKPGLGQSYLGAALLHHFEGLHVQSFDLSLLLSDSTRTPEAVVVQFFVEVRRHKPSVIYIPNVDVWYRTLSPTVITTFTGLLRSIPPTEPILLLGYVESEPDDTDRRMVKDLFGYTKQNAYELLTPKEPARIAFYQDIYDYIRKPPSEFPNPDLRPKRTPEILSIAPPPPPRVPTKDELRAQKKRDRQLLYWLKVKIQPVMDQLKLKYRKFRTGVIDVDKYPYLYPESNEPEKQPPQPITFRPYELDTDKNGVQGLREAGSGKFFYNLNIVIIEERLANGYYKRPKDYLFDVRTLEKDAKQTDDRDRRIKAHEMLANVEVDVANLEQDPTLADCENVYRRELKREAELKKKAATIAQDSDGFAIPLIPSSATTNGHSHSQSAAASRGFITPRRPSHSLSNGTSNHTNSGNHDDTDVAMADAGNSPVLATQKSVAIPTSSYRGLSQYSQQQGIGGAVTLTPMPPGSQLDDFANDGSTTTSGKKTDNSGPSSGGRATQLSNGGHTKKAPSFTGFGATSKFDSQLIATQDMMSPPAMPPSSEPDSQIIRATQPPVPPFLSAAHEQAKQYNDPTEPNPPLKLSESFFKQLHERFVRKSSGCTVEQHEQIYATLMDRLWKERNNWNRVEVGTLLKEDFNMIVRDIEETQNILPASYPTDDDDDLVPFQ